MAINYEYIIHEQDKAAMDALKAIPGFAGLVKGFLGVYSERQLHILNMADKLKVGNGQLDQYQQMLEGIAEKLGIECPELYVELNVSPNSYTSGDNNPYIVVTSGLLDTLPEELVPTVLAHECGHIVCHHVLYHTIGRLVLSGAMAAVPFGQYLSMPLQLALIHWMRCSELSADRVAVLCDGTADKMIDVCMYFAGYNKRYGLGSRELFMRQGEQYAEYVNDSKWNKTLELMMVAGRSHPFTAVRAYECQKWADSDQFEKIMAHETDVSGSLIPVAENARAFVGKDANEVYNSLVSMGFTNVTMDRVTVKKLGYSEGKVISVSIDGNSSFGTAGWYDPDSFVTVTYYSALNDSEQRSLHPGQVKMPNGNAHYYAADYRTVYQEIADAGFTNITLIPQPDLKNTVLVKDGAVTKVYINGGKAKKDIWWDPDEEVTITYHTMMENNES